MPAISVIMPLYNRATVVGRAVDSVLGQEFEDFELIVVDDGSSDGSAEAVAAFMDPRLKLIRMPANAGGNAARNRGVDAATAPLLAFLDSDDFYLPHKLGFAVRWFEQHPEIDVLLDSFIKRYPTARRRADVELRNPVLESNEAILEALFNRTMWKATPGITVRREVAIRAGKFDEGLKRRQDFDFIVRLAKVGRCGTTDELLWVKTFPDDSISANLDTFVDSTLEFFKRHPEYYDVPAFRSGFALDVGRHFARLARQRKAGAALRDAWRLAKAVGPLRFAALLAAGSGRFKRRKARLRRARGA